MILFNLTKDIMFSGLVVPDVPLEETEILRKEATDKNIELVGFLPAISFLFELLQVYIN